MVMGNALWHLIKQSDAVSQLVLWVLLAMSIACWALFMYKVILLNAKKKQLSAAIAHIRGVHTLDQLLETATLFAGTIAGYFLSRNLSFLKGLLEYRKSDDIVSLSQMQWDFMEQNIYQTVDEMVANEEAHQPLFATSAAIAPLLGLFGTVWGLVHSFIRISEKQSADIATVAPGIAEALIATMAGLVIAIPALVMFSYLNTQIRIVDQRLIILADRFSFVVQRQLLFAADHARSFDKKEKVDFSGARSPHATL